MLLPGCGPREAAEDVAATTFDRALATVENYSYRGRPALAWLYGIASNVVKETLRRDVRQQASRLVEDLFHWHDVSRSSASLLPLPVDDTEGLASRMDLEIGDEATDQCATRGRASALLCGPFGNRGRPRDGPPETAVYALQARALAALRRHLA